MVNREVLGEKSHVMIGQGSAQAPGQWLVEHSVHQIGSTFSTKNRKSFFVDSSLMLKMGIFGRSIEGMEVGDVERSLLGRSS